MHSLCFGYMGFVIIFSVLPFGGTGLELHAGGTSVSGASDWIWLFGGCAVFAAALFAALRVRNNRGGRALGVVFGESSVTTVQKLAVLMPVVEHIRNQHRLSRFGFDICPEKIRITRNAATLRLRSATLRGDGLLALRAGYSAPERYNALQPVGPWTDIYAACALLYLAITGSAPPPAFGLADDEPIFKEPVPSEFKKLVALIEQGLTVDCRKRPASLDGVVAEMQAILLHKQCHNEEAELRSPHKKSSGMEHRMGPVRRLVMIACAVCVLLGGALLVLEINYTQAILHMENAEFDRALKSINGVFAFYRDAGDMQVYVKAFNLLGEGSYNEAAALFGSLGDYSDAQRMVSETAYQSAVDLLEAGSFDEAQIAFAALEGYADAPLMVMEARYRKAAAAMKSGKLIEAKSALEALHPYRDSAELLAELNGRIYEEALAVFGQGQYAQAAAYFACVPGYGESDSYGALCDLLQRIKQHDFSRIHYDLLMSYADGFDIAEFVLSDAAICYYLEGRWQDESGHTFELHENGGISCSLPLPDGGFYELRDAALIVGQSAGDTQALVFEYLGADKVLVYCNQNGRQYTLMRRR